MTLSTTRPVTGAQYDIAAGDYIATITELGAGLRQLSREGRPLIAGHEADELPAAARGQILVPWPNRIDGGRYSFEGQSFQLDLSEPARGMAIHGLTRWANWRVITHAANAVELALDLLGQPGYPFSLELRARYRLTPDAGLEVTLTARNPGSRPAPFGAGWHPYLLAGDDSVDDWQLQLPASRWLPCDDRGIPVAEPQDVSGTPVDFRVRRAIGALVLDHSLTGLRAETDGRVRAVLAGPGAEVELWAGAGYHWLQVFTGDTLGPDARRRSVAIEPMSCPPNAFVSGADLLTIRPGEAVSLRWGMSATLR